MLRIQLKIILYLKKLIPKNNIDKFDDEFIHEITILQIIQIKYY